jgi:siroheme synthase-like protein
VRSFGYPVYLDLDGVPVLVVGAGPIAARKVEGLVAAGAAVTVVAPDVSPALDRSTVVAVVERPFEPGDLIGMRLVITATGDADVDATVAAAATALSVFQMLQYWNGVMPISDTTWDDYRAVFLRWR